MQLILFLHSFCFFCTLSITLFIDFSNLSI
nr:MAG TPA: hypothetical protein [Caudoviricetes sp.]